MGRAFYRSADSRDVFIGGQVTNRSAFTRRLITMEGSERTWGVLTVIDHLSKRTGSHKSTQVTAKP